MSVLITGGAGFIGINFVMHMLSKTNEEMFVIDKMGYASNENMLRTLGVNYQTIDICDNLDELFEKHQFKHIIHFAAESHVDNSIKNSMPFVQSNVFGTVNLLDYAVKYGIEKFVHISTDEVFGDVVYPNKFDENSNIRPRNPYSASKASAEHFVIAYGNTHKLPYVIINSSNNYGPFQHKEKLIPSTITKILQNQKIPVYGDGKQIRDWIYVEDTCEIILRLFYHGVNGHRYCIGGDNEIENLDMVKMLLNKMGANENLIEFVKDRPGHDLRYSTDISRVKIEMTWQPKTPISVGLDKTIGWYKNAIL